MKNMAMKNLILVGALAIFALAFNNAFAYSGYRESVVDLNSQLYTLNYNNYSNPSNTSNYQPNYNSQNTYLQQQPYTYMTPVQPVSTSPVYAPQTTTYVPTYSSTGKTVTPVPTATTTTGNYINFDRNNGMMGAAYYGGMMGQQPVQNINDNGVTALTVAGSGSFLPSSVFQWFLFILLVLAIIIVARMISKRSKTEVHVAH